MWHVVWFKRDLRCADHAPLARAAAAGAVLPLYIVEPELWAQPDAGGRQWDFVRESLVALRAALAVLGLPLVVRSGDVVTVLARLHRQQGIASIHAHQETGNDWTFQRDRRVFGWVREQGIALTEYPGFGVVRRLRSRERWTARWEQVMRAPDLPLQIASQPGLPFDAGAIPDWPTPALPADACRDRQRGGRPEALALLDSFLAERGRHYTREMSSPLSAASACSRLSPHLAWGTIGLRELVQRVRTERSRCADPWRRSLASLESRLHWHCHFIQKLESEPDIEFRNVHPGFDGLREADFDANRFDAWRRGETGWPFVDACLRMLAQTGWINFRMRAMLVAVSSYHLWLHWREPALFLARQFTDYEPGIHFPQVQMQSGVTGINIPRIYNPVQQSHDQDPRGVFIRRWLPELRGVPDGFLHTPWLMGQTQQQAAGCRIGTHYPAPVVDHEIAAREARNRYLAWRRQPGMQELAESVLRKHGSRKRSVAVRRPERSPQSDLFSPQ
ncbi:MAG: deoxyribodipyrimidine photo-lyase [Rhodanobacteraceae bacterium]|nr:deoxyribodipyrimidine photo-lyase [Rhodanobacteraceae bacterium]MBL0040496.1 deoxyribodipyrimidine photo-lyase [Xanthomonadales bacterium]MBP6079134.1 deoxyribodipyrimidine photo-lyase [Xanthomonadales bacterium]MBP7622814.1 deoxyribodipyrimidine photo-lyase [Xanthomonadales bacterium]